MIRNLTNKTMKKAMLALGVAFSIGCLSTNFIARANGVEKTEVVKDRTCENIETTKYLNSIFLRNLMEENLKGDQERIKSDKPIVPNKTRFYALLGATTDYIYSLESDINMGEIHATKIYCDKDDLFEQTKKVIDDLHKNKYFCHVEKVVINKVRQENPNEFIVTATVDVIFDKDNIRTLKKIKSDYFIKVTSKESDTDYGKQTEVIPHFYKINKLN